MIGFLVVAVVVVAAAFGVRFRSTDGFDRYRPLDVLPTPVDRKYSDVLLSNDYDDQKRFDALFGYFLSGFIENTSNDGSFVHYPGLPSLRGYDVSGLEGFARTAPLLGAWVYSERKPVVIDPGTGEGVDIVSVLRRAIVAGTDPIAAGYWGEIEASDSQRVVEAADIARVLWMTRKDIWEQLSAQERTNIVNWLSQVNGVTISNRNNWLLFPEVVNAFLKSVGYKTGANYPSYTEFKSNYLERGWFRDGPDGRVDYYNAWGISYDLFWLHLMDPALDAQFIENTLEASADLTAHLVSPAGIPIMGRSLCYRTGIPSSIIAGSFVSAQSISPGMARRALDVTWRYFIQRGALRNGTLTMGYTDTDPRLVDWYSGAGSCHWGLRSLTLAYMAKPDDAFWTAEQERLPVEISDFRLNLPKLGWVVEGVRMTKDIKIIIPGNARNDVAVASYTEVSRAIEYVTQRPVRPKNEALKYSLAEYDAQRPFGGLLTQREAAPSPRSPQRGP